MPVDDVTSLRIVRLFPASPEAVFDAWLDPQSIRVWMCPGEISESVATVDARVGGAFEIVMRSPGFDDVHIGEYREIDRPRRLVFTWSSAGTRRRDSLVTIELRPHGAGECELTLVHSQLVPEAVGEHDLGWQAHLRELVVFLGGDRAYRRAPARS